MSVAVRCGRINVNNQEHPGTANAWSVRKHVADEGIVQFLFINHSINVDLNPFDPLNHQSFNPLAHPPIHTTRSLPHLPRRLIYSRLARPHSYSFGVSILHIRHLTAQLQYPRQPHNMIEK